MGCVVVTKTNFVGFFPKKEGDMALMSTWLQKKHTCPIPMQDVRWKNQKAIGHSICQMDQMDLQFSIGLLHVHWIQWTNGMSIGQQWINRNYASTE